MNLQAMNKTIVYLFNQRIFKQLRRRQDDTNKKRVGFKLLAYVSLLFVGVLSAAPVSAAPNLAPAHQISDIALPTLVFGTDASLAIARDGTTHVAFRSAGPLSENIYPVQYAACTARCERLSNWSVIALGNAMADGGGVRLRLDSQGRPRLMWYVRDFSANEGLYVYAECNQKCLKPENWQAIGLAKSHQYSLNDEEYFTLDSQGRPRFLFQNMDRVAYYASCERVCTQETNWMATPINTPNFEPFNFELAYDNNNRPRVSFVTSPRTVETYIGFATCDTNCTNAAQWSVLPRLAQIGVDYDHSLAVDSQGRPRLAIYTGGYANGPTPYDYLLLWMGCDARCTIDKNWFYQPLPLPAMSGEDVDLSLDAQDQVRLVYQVGGSKESLGGLGYTWCTARCTTNNPTWQSTMLMTTEYLDAVEPLRDCAWLYVGQHPSLGVDRAKNLQVAYETEVICDSGSAGRRIRFLVQPQP